LFLLGAIVETLSLAKRRGIFGVGNFSPNKIPFFQQPLRVAYDEF